MTVKAVGKIQIITSAIFSMKLSTCMGRAPNPFHPITGNELLPSSSNHQPLKCSLVHSPVLMDRSGRSPVFKWNYFLSACFSVLYSSFLLGFIGNQPLATRSFCSNSSPMDHSSEAPSTPTQADSRMSFINTEPHTHTMPRTRNTHHGRVPK